MRVQIVGNSEAAKSLRGHLSTLSDLAIVDAAPDFSVHLKVEQGPYVTVDGVDGQLEALVTTYLAEGMGNVLVKRGGGNRRDDVIVVGIPDGMDQPAEQALFRALSGLGRPKTEPKPELVEPKGGWWKKRLW